MLFPTTLKHHRNFTRNNGVRLVPATYAVDTLDLCLRYRMPSLLPSVMYTLSNYDHRFLIHGILDPTRNRNWELVTSEKTFMVGGVVSSRTSDTEAIPKPMRVLDVQPWAREENAHIFRENEAERLKAMEEGREPRFNMDPEFDQREILARILRGRAHLQTARRDIIFGFLQDIPSFPDDLGKKPDDPDAEYPFYGYKFSEGCRSPSKIEVPQLDGVSCASALKALMTEMWTLEARRFTKDRLLPKPRHALRILPLRVDAQWGNKEEWLEDLCPSCLNKFKFEMMRGQRELWSKLPEIFGMKSWLDIEIESRLITEAIAKEWMEWLGGLYDPETGAAGALYKEDTSYLDYDLSKERADVRAEMARRKAAKEAAQAAALKAAESSGQSADSSKNT